MPAICFYFQVHQPFRVRKYRIFDIGKDSNYFNDNSESNLNNLKVLQKVAGKCYLPMNKLLLSLLKKYPEFKVSFSFSGVFLEQLENALPEVLKSFKDLVKTGQVELLSETYYHSLSSIYSKEEFFSQINLHSQKLNKLFKFKPKVFRNTELIYSNEIAKLIKELGFLGVIAEGADHILTWKSPNFLYHPPNDEKTKLLLKNYRLSDDIAFRFSSRDWSDYPLTSEKFASWVSAVNGGGDVVNLFMDYETFGEHQWEDSGIFEFMKALPKEILKHPDNSFLTPSEVIANFPVRGELDVPNYISWADIERDLSAWVSNKMQSEALQSIYDLEGKVLKSQNKKIIDDWRKLQTSDHFYYMCTKWFNDGDVHKYFNPYESPYEAFISYMNVLKDLQLRLEQKLK